MDALNELAKNKRIPDAAAFKALGGKLTPEMAEDCGYYFLKQQNHEKQFTADIAVIRDFHVEKLKESAGEYRAKGQVAMAKRIAARADEAADLDAWLALLRPDDVLAAESKFIDWLRIVRFKSDNGIQLFIEGERMRIAGNKGFECRIDEMGRTVTWGKSGKRASINVNPDRKSGVWTNVGGVKRQLTVIQMSPAKEPQAEAIESPVVGSWRWREKDVVRILPNGTVLNEATGQKGSWKLPDHLVVAIDWDGGKWVDTLNLSEDGQSLKGKNQEGHDVWASRVAE